MIGSTMGLDWTGVPVTSIRPGDVLARSGERLTVRSVSRGSGARVRITGDLPHGERLSLQWPRSARVALVERAS